MNIIRSIFGFHAKRRNLNPDEANGEALFETQILTLHNLAADIVDYASAVNFVAAGGNLAALLSCQRIFPVAEINAMAAAGNVGDGGQTRDILFWSSLLRRNISIAARATDQLIAVARSQPDVRPSEIAMQDCVRQWRNVVTIAIDAVNALEPESRWRLAGRYVENAFVLIRYFRMIGEGRWPSIDVTGAVVRLTLPQRRRLPRFELRQPCRIHAGLRTVAGNTLDISIGGIGVTSPSQLRLKEEVTIELHGGRRLAGIVAWIKDRRIGIQFADELSADDPLVAG